MDITTIIMILFVIIGAYLLTTDQIQGTSKLVLTIFIVIITVIILVNLPMFNSYYEFTSSVLPATSPTIIPGTSYTAASSSYSVSTWIYIDDWNTGYGKVKTIMNRQMTAPKATKTTDNPGIYLDGNVNDLLINFTTIDGAVNSIKIENISIQKWVNITICFGDKTVDTYINGKLVKTYVTKFPQIGVTQSSESTNPGFSITPDGGFGGSIANTRYYDRFLTPQESWDIYTKGFNNNWLNQFNASFTFYQNQNVKAQFYLL